MFIKGLNAKKYRVYQSLFILMKISYYLGRRFFMFFYRWGWFSFVYVSALK